jgi:hypothetical protein
MHWLRALDVSLTCTKEDLSVVAGLANLRELSLGDSIDMERELRELHKFPKLQTLRLVGAALSDGALSCLKDLTEHRDIELDLDIKSSTDSRLSDAGLSYLAGLKHATIRRLDLSLSDVTDVGLMHMAGLRIKSLILGARRSITADGLKGLGSVVALEELDFNDTTSINDASLKYLKDLVNLRSLTLDRTQVTDAGLRHLKDLPRLEDLSLAECKCAGPGLATLRDFHDLRRLNLRSSGLTDAHLIYLKDLRVIDDLYLSNTTITDAGVEWLSSLNSLRTLVVRHTNIAGPGLRFLVGLPKFRQLDLIGTRVGNNEAKYIAALKHLEILRIRMGDAGLVQLTGMRGLRELQLEGAGFTDASIAALAKFPNLTFVDAGTTGISHSGSMRLRFLRPNCCIVP